MGLSSEASLRFIHLPACNVHELHQHFWLGAVLEVIIDKTQETKFHSRAGLDAGRADGVVVAQMIVHEALLVTLVHVMGRLPVPPSPATWGCAVQNRPHPRTVSLRCGTMAKMGGLGNGPGWVTTASSRSMATSWAWSGLGGVARSIGSGSGSTDCCWSWSSARASWSSQWISRCAGPIRWGPAIPAATN